MPGQWDNNGGLTLNSLTAQSTVTVPVGGFTIGAVPVTATATQINTVVGSLGTRRLPLTQARNADGSSLVATSPGATDFTIVSTPGTVLNLAGHAAQNNAKTDNAIFEVVLPSSYTAGANVTLTIQSSYAVASGTTLAGTVDATAYLLADAGTEGADICATSAQTITASKVDYAFTLTGTTLTPGARILIQVTTVVSEGGNAGTITGKVWSVRLS